MELMEDHSDFYDRLDILRKDGVNKVYSAREKSVEAPCVYHEIHYGDGSISDHSREAALSVLKRVALLTHPRAPRLADAWFASDHMVAIEFRTENQPFSAQANNPLARGGVIPRHEVLHETLELLAAIHHAGIVHGRPVAETFGIGDRNKIYLNETGLDRSLANCFKTSDANSFMELSTNVYAHDVGCWAFAMLSLMVGEEFTDEDVDEKWDDFALKKARQRLEDTFSKEPLRNFFLQCLGGLCASAKDFDNGVIALEAWRKNELQEHVS